MATLAEFIQEHGIERAAVEPAAANPNMTGEDSADMNHWTVTLFDGERRSNMTIPFSMGSGHNGAEPELADVLDCLASDAAGYENSGASFEEWAGEYGYDTDSRRAEATFRAIAGQSEQLAAFLGQDAYKALLWEVERD